MPEASQEQICTLLPLLFVVRARSCLTCDSGDVELALES